MALWRTLAGKELQVKSRDMAGAAVSALLGNQLPALDAVANIDSGDSALLEAHAQERFIVVVNPFGNALPVSFYTFKRHRRGFRLAEDVVLQSRAEHLAGVVAEFQVA